MASLQRQPSRRSTQPEQTPAPPARSESGQSEDSQTVLLNKPQLEEKETLQNSELEGARHVPTPEDDPNLKKCWICFCDETEDTSETSPWRDPCPCALVAHEQCLLDWIADTEAPKNIGRGGALSGPQILCPQCKSEIKLARSRNYVVDMVRAFDRMSARVVMPGGVMLLSADVLYKISFAHGVHSIYRVFGATDADRILAPIRQYWAQSPIDLDSPVSEIRQRLLASLAHHIQHWRLYFGLPMITPLVLLSRTSWHFSEAFLTILPTVFFALQPSSKDEILELGVWPPSASMAFALLPYARQAYNLYYERVWGERERQWKREVLPPTSQVQAAEEDANRDPAQRIENAVEDADVFEIRVDGGIWEDWEEPPPEAMAPQEVNNQDRPAPGQEAVQGGPGEADEAAPAPNIPDTRAQAAQPVPHQHRAPLERRLAFSPAAVAENVLGALAFPTIAELSGELLRLTLPKSWTTLPAVPQFLFGGKTSTRAAQGILQEKWGRSLIGGCLFVVFKDALLLYVRWKMAQMHRNRRVLNFDRSKSRSRA